MPLLLLVAMVAEMAVLLLVLEERPSIATWRRPAVANKLLPDMFFGGRRTASENFQRYVPVLSGREIRPEEAQMTLIMGLRGNKIAS